MARDTQGAQLAHIADTVTSLDGRLADLQEAQGAIVSTLHQLLEIAEAQSEMLAEVLGAAKQDGGPSPVADQLAKLTVAVEQSGAGVREVMEQLGALPEQIGAAIADADTRSGKTS